MITYGSVCSGIEAASAAWHPLGWKADWFSEIEKFPSAVLAHHYPDVPNLGDMTKIAGQVRAGLVPAPDVMVGGTPCQAFSIAGLRQSLKDPRGQLTLSYVDLANAIDDKRAENGLPPAVHVWENVPGSLYTPDNALGYFLAGMAGEVEAFEPGPRPERGKNSKFWRWSKKTDQHIAKWPKSGCVYGRQRRVAWRILDAQYFGVPQRRRRIFVVASAADGFDPAEILFEFDGVRRNSPPSRESGQAVAALTARGVGTCGADDNQAQAGHLIAAFGGGNCSGALDVAACLTAKGQRIDYEVETFIAESHCLQHSIVGRSENAGPEGKGHQKECAFTLNSRSEADIVAYAIAENSRGELRYENGDGSIVGTVSTGGGKPGQGTPVVLEAQCAIGEISHTLTAEGHDASEDGTGRGVPVVAYGSNGHASFAEGLGPLRAKPGADHENLAVHCVHGTQDPDTLRELAHTLGRNHGQENADIAFGSKDFGGDACEGLSPTLRASNSLDSHPNAGAPPAIAYMEARSVALRGREGGATAELGDEVAGCLRASSGGGDKPHVMHHLAVRRLTPVECERLQGFPDDRTQIPWRKHEAEDCPDGPRYKAIGNSMAVPVMQWIGQRIGKYHEKAQINRDNGSDGENIDVPGRGNNSARLSVVPAGKPVRNKPFLKWVGGKFSVIEDVLQHLPTGKRLIEPFAGGGSIFMNAGFEKTLVNDVNPDLILTYRQLATEAHALITKVHLMFQELNTQECYLDVRSRFNARTYSDFERAAAFIYLNRHCFNGLVRYNAKGEFNVGYGKYKKPYFPLEEMEGFLGIADTLQFSCSTFEDVIAQAGEGDVIFCDPPYEPHAGSDGFTRYSGQTFTFVHQVALITSIKAAVKRGAKAVVTNSNADSILNLYLKNGLTINNLYARRSVSCQGDSRETANDIIATLNCSNKC